MITVGAVPAAIRTERAALPETVAATRAFWATVAEHVAAKVEPARRQSQRRREPIITYLRDLEGIARLECRSRQTIQIIASGRHLLGDVSEVGGSAMPEGSTQHGDGTACGGRS